MGPDFEHIKVKVIHQIYNLDSMNKVREVDRLDNTLLHCGDITIQSVMIRHKSCIIAISRALSVIETQLNSQDVA